MGCVGFVRCKARVHGAGSELGCGVPVPVLCFEGARRSRSPTSPQRFCVGRDLRGLDLHSCCGAFVLV